MWKNRCARLLALFLQNQITKAFDESDVLQGPYCELTEGPISFISDPGDSIECDAMNNLLRDYYNNFRPSDIQCCVD